MTKNSDEGRKSARAKQAKKRDEDILEAEGAAEEEKAEVKKAPRTSAKKRGEEASSEAEEASAETAPEAEEEADQAEEAGASEKAEETAKDAASAEEEVEAAAETEEAAGEAEEEPEEPEEEIDPLEAGQAWLVTLFDKMSLDLEVKAEQDGDNFVFNISGDDADALVGRSHQSPRVLKSIQTLLSEHLGKAARGNVVVDLGGFKQKRHSRLVGIAEQLHEAVGRTGEPIKIAGLNSYERRVVHQHLADFKDVETESVDHGIFRKLRIVPD